MTIQEIQNARQPNGAGETWETEETPPPAARRRRRPEMVADLSLEEFEDFIRFLVLDAMQDALDNCGYDPDAGLELSEELIAEIDASIANPGKLIPAEEVAKSLGLNW